MASWHKKIEYLFTLHEEDFCLDYCPSYLAKMRYYKNMRRRNRKQTVQKTVNNIAIHKKEVIFYEL